MITNPFPEFTMYHLIGLGSNWQAEQQMKKMLSCLKRLDKLLSCSAIVSTMAFGKKNAPSYLNAVVCLQSSMSEVAMRKWCKSQESSLGRGKYAFLPDVCEADFDLLASWKCIENMPSHKTIAEDYYRSLAKSVLLRYAKSQNINP